MIYEGRYVVEMISGVSWKSDEVIQVLGTPAFDIPARRSRPESRILNRQP